MRIESSLISMAGRSSSFAVQTKEESLRMWTGNQRPDFQGNSTSGKMPNHTNDKLELSREGFIKLRALRQETALGVEDGESITFELSEKDRQKIELIREILERLTGKKIRFLILDGIKLEDLEPAAAQKPGRVHPEMQGWGLEYDFSQSYYESQKLTFSSEGTIRTEDGREINFSVDLSMSREFASTRDISIRAGDAAMKDPLVINYGGGAAGLTDSKISFDIDSDGTPDQISTLAPGSGFIALDVNEDGKINNGGELFGTASGDGFADLAAFDSDSNNWIDENDPIFDKLRIWTNEPDGSQKLFALGQKGIGAIYLGNVDTEFDLKNSSNELQGAIQKTGIFLREDGTAGTVQHVDLAI